MSHCLIEIPRTDWTELRDLYVDRKRNACSYNTIQNCINWIAQWPEVAVTFYSLDGDWRQDGTYIALDANEKLVKIYCNTLSENKERLITALNCLNLKSPYFIYGFQERLKEAVVQHFLDTGCSEEDFKPDGTFWYHIPLEKVEKLSIDPPDGVTLRALDERHGDHINSIWPHRLPGSEHFVKRLIRFNQNIGAFDEKGNLLAWCLTLPLGSLGLLQVEEGHKRKGLGSSVVQHLAKWYAASNKEVLASVIFDNIASRTMFEKLGFEIIDKVYWVIKPIQPESRNIQKCVAAPLNSA